MNRLHLPASTLRLAGIAGLGLILAWHWMPSGKAQNDREDRAESRPGKAVPHKLSSPRATADLPPLEARIRATYERAMVSTGIMFSSGPAGEKYQGSGVIISKSGHFLTHAHHHLPPGSPLTILLGSSEKHTARLLGVNEFYDMSLVQLDGAGPWVPVPLGSPAKLSPNEPCLALGVPSALYRPGQRPLPRLGRVLGYTDYQVMTTCRIAGGDSGGPLLTLNGELLGVHRVLPSQATSATHVTVDIYRLIREQLESKTLVTVTSELGPFTRNTELESLGRSTSPAVVTVLCNKRPSACGIVVDSAGFVVTKASELSGGIVCRLADGRELPATLYRRSVEHDLALLKIDAKDLPTAKWGDSAELKVGRVIGSVAADKSRISFGIVTGDSGEVPPERGYLTFDLDPKGGDPEGVRITKVWDGRPNTSRVVRAGDVVLELGGRRTKTVEDYVSARDNALKQPLAAVGASVSISVRRGEEALRLEVPIESPSNPFEGHSLRSSGFPRAFVHDAVVPRNQCGSPVVDASGLVVAMNIASLELHGTTYAIPADVVQQVVKELRQP